MLKGPKLKRFKSIVGEGAHSTGGKLKLPCIVAVILYGYLDAIIIT